ncbi:MAG: hypothetical protein WBA38_04230 [Gordonia sp. (in: high G+C Gram-positive bacteria)]|uniref:hypothetical protein n=1 Tax=Gordonia sp. (in: high G+C Gram-positive bacteria) TaxID=84139 RepID=UPI003C752357
MSAHEVIAAALNGCVVGEERPGGGIYVEATLFLDAWAQVALEALATEGYAVVKLPKPDEIDGDGQVYFDDCDIRVDATSRQPLDIYLYGSAIVVSPDLLRRTAAARLAAAQYAEGGESGE